MKRFAFTLLGLAVCAVVSVPGACQGGYDFEPGPRQIGFGLNNRGTIVTFGFDPDSGADVGAFYSASGLLTTFTVPGSFDTDARGVNNSDTVVGTYDTFGFPQEAGFVRRADGGISTYLFPGSQVTEFDGINDAGTVLGFQFTSASNSGQFLLQRNGKVRSIPVPAGHAPGEIGWVALNNDETLLGSRFDATTGAISTLIAHDRTIETVDIPGANDILPGTINNAGEVSGTYDFRGPTFFVSHGFVRSRKGHVATVDYKFDWPVTETVNLFGPVDLTFLSDSGTVVNAINDRGQLIGYASAQYLGIIKSPFGTFVIILQDIRTFIATPHGNDD
jgi:hypothetical protein